jgi:predicted deacylase
VVHGDEIAGVEIIRRVLRQVKPASLQGTVIAVPVVNVFGFINQSRYLPDRRDLNRSFPGSPRGSLAGRLAHLFMTEVVEGCTHGIDLHTGSAHRRNLPQVRGNLADPEIRRIACAFGAPVMIHSKLRDGSLREAATRRGIATLLYEGGGPFRFHEDAVAVGVQGVLRVMTALGMGEYAEPCRQACAEAGTSFWVRARRSGLFRPEVKLGETVESGQRLGAIDDTLGDLSLPVRAPEAGMVIALAMNPLVSQGDAMAHLARVAAPPAAG